MNVKGTVIIVILKPLVATQLGHLLAIVMSVTLEMAQSAQVSFKIKYFRFLRRFLL